MKPIVKRRPLKDMKIN